MTDVPATRRAHGATTVPPTLVAASAISIGVSACVSTLLAYYATFAVSIVCLARAISPERVDGALAPLDAHVRRTAQLALAAIASSYADVEVDVRRLRDAARGHAVLAPIYARAEERARLARATVAGWVDGLKRMAGPKWSEQQDVALAVLFLFRLIAAVINLGATVLINAAYEEAKIRAPSVLGYLRDVIKAIRSPPFTEDEEAAESCGFELKDIVSLVAIAVCLLYSTDLLFHTNFTSGMLFYSACFVPMCGFALLVAEGVYLRDNSGETDTTSDRLNTANTSRRVGNGGEARRDAELEERESWGYLWLLIVITYCIDAILLRATLGPRFVALALLGRCNVEIIKVGRRIQLTPDDGEGAEGSTGGVNGGVDRWSSAVMAVLAASSVKVLGIFLVLDFHLAALSFASLCIMAAFLLVEEASLSDVDASGDEDSGEEGAGLAEDVAGGAEEADEVRAEHPNTSTVAVFEFAEDGSATEEQCNSSEDHVEEQSQQEEQDSSSMDGWDFVEVDPEMPIKDHGGANRKLSTIFPWKYAA
ncbi:uncharacterized protein LOC133889120 [Phragmites australis]|uniref:uncharacterized protein LOC133889120 n=1 Tax=Phragmites australis TaxID=29695 RepID=UPI002D7A0A2B|nr:uncharacterized protein LOC133889120 [Phragmites australis]